MGTRKSELGPEPVDLMAALRETGGVLPRRLFSQQLISQIIDGELSGELGDIQMRPKEMHIEVISPQVTEPAPN